MPGWHDATRRLQESSHGRASGATGKLQMVGIVQEQHPARARLFMQWRRMDWPVMVDSLGLLGVKVVPITLLIDEHGIVRFRGERENLETFLETEYPEPAETAPALAVRPDLERLEKAAISPDGWRRFADGLVLWGEVEDLDSAIDAYRKALGMKPSDESTHFRLGVAYRKRYDSERRREGDFTHAVEHWAAALDADPNQYIWRRRIQQYGPRSTKPYPFYDWVATARREIAARGETPVTLPVDPRGAEIARPAKRFAADAGERASPDPQGRIQRDVKGLIRLEQTAVPPALEPGGTARVHLAFRPATEIEAHWNNEAGDLEVWIDPPAGWRVDRRHRSVPNPPELVSDEERRVELELESPGDFTGTATVPGYALYYVCEDVKGTCLYRRRDFAVLLQAEDSL